MAEVLRELRATALEPVLSWHPERSRRPALRTLLEGVADRLASVAQRRGAPDPPLAGIAGARRRWWRSAADSGCIRPCRAWANTVTHRDPAVRLASVQALAQLGTPGRARADGQGDRGRRPRGPPGRRAGGRRAGLQGRAQAGRAGRAGEDREGDGPHREDGVLRGLRRHRGRRRAEGAERHAAAARAAQAEGVVRDPRLRRDRHRQDPHARGARDPDPGARTTRTSWSATP